MHARYSTSQDDGRNAPFPPGVGPRGAKHKEHGQGHDASNSSDDCGTNNVCRAIDTNVIGDGGISKVVHAADGSSAEDTADYDSPPGNNVIRTNSNKSSEEHKNRDEEGDGSEAARVCYLQLRLSVCKVNGSVTDEMLETISLCRRSPPRFVGLLTMHQMAMPPMVTAELTRSRLSGLARCSEAVGLIS